MKRNRPRHPFAHDPVYIDRVLELNSTVLLKRESDYSPWALVVVRPFYSHTVHWLFQR